MTTYIFCLVHVVQLLFGPSTRAAHSMISNAESFIWLKVEMSSLLFILHKHVCEIRPHWSLKKALYLHSTFCSLTLSESWLFALSGVYLRCWRKSLLIIWLKHSWVFIWKIAPAPPPEGKNSLHPFPPTLAFPREKSLFPKGHSPRSTKP